jgi:alpha-beta hydrolase superfamily lysophospholipase
MTVRRPYRILLWLVGGLLAACAALVSVAVLLIPRPTAAELARDSTVPTPSSGPGHGWRYASDGTRLYQRVYRTAGPRRGIVLYVAGITGLGGDEQLEFVSALAGRGFEVRYLHPRGTGYSDGPRGDIADLDRYLEDYRQYARAVAPERTPVVVVGHSMGGVFALRVAAGLPNTAGLVLINPTHRYAASAGSSPTILQYVAYAACMVFVPGDRVVDMGGRPEAITGPEDRAEAIRRRDDPLVVRWFSMRAMLAAKQVMDGAPTDAARCRCPLLLVDGDADRIVDRAGHAVLLNAYAGADKTRLTVPAGGHGYATVRHALPTIAEWVDARGTGRSPRR